ncbi:MAG: Fic family protein [Candidatus Marinimicrobia bacterium]|nr:Fic family protein [Candidatus Neomarinimicrobiota bacterium]
MKQVFKTKIIDILKAQANLSSKEIFDNLDIKISYATVKRYLLQLSKDKLISHSGMGKARKYSLSKTINLHLPINIEDYFRKEIDERIINKHFSFHLINDILKHSEIFTEKELINLQENQENYYSNKTKLDTAEFNKEMERLAIDLSWKSSEIEGNTYSLLETERLLKEKLTAEGKSKDDAVMLLNHKEAIDFILKEQDYFTELSIAKIENIHALLIKELGVGRNIRKRRVGITGTNYVPLDNEFQIKEALRDMCLIVNKRKNIFEKAFLALILISYIQAFTDGNKRLARIIANALLLSKNFCPISFRTVNSIDYKKAMLIFYEQNNITAMKDIFIRQFEFATNSYF